MQSKLILRLALYLLFSCISALTYGADRFWISGTASNWNNTANWSTTSGGAGGASVPGAADVALFDGNGLGNCAIDIAPTISGMNINGYSGTIDLSGQNFVINGTSNLIFASGTINDTPGTGSLAMTTTGSATFSGTTVGAATTVTAGMTAYNGSTFNSTLNSTQNGTVGTNGLGGNTFNGATTILNTGSAELRLGNSNPDIFNSTVTFTSSGSGFIRVAHNAMGNQFNGNVTVNSTGSSAGVRFGEGGASTSTLATGLTLVIGGGGFTSGNLHIYDFTQTGSTGQALTLTGTGFLYLVRTTWGGNINFTAPQLRTDASTYSGTSRLNKTGAIDDVSAGGNTFTGASTIINSGSGLMTMGSTSGDVFQNDLAASSSGTNALRLANNSAGNSVAGNLNATLSGAATGLFIADQAMGVMAVTGNATILSLGTATHQIDIADAGTITVGGTFALTNNSTAATATFSLANATGSFATITGESTFTNNGSGATTQQFAVGENGTITFNGNVNFINSATATTSDISVHSGSNATTSFNENVTVQSTAVGCDGVLFGAAGGDGTLATGRTITIGVGGFVDGTLLLGNFTQVGSTAQSLTATGSATMQLNNSSWGGNVVFAAPRLTTASGTFSGTTQLTKSGANNDISTGDNTFIGNTTITNSGAGDFTMGSGDFDDFQANLTVNNSGSGVVNIADNSAGNTVGGDLLATVSGTATGFNLARLTSSGITVTGTTVFNYYEFCHSNHRAWR